MMNIRFQVQRQSSERGSWIETFDLEAQSNATILDCLNRIKWEQDGSLAFRKNCRNTICGSCAIRMDGRAVLACQQTLQGELNRRERLEPNLVPTDLIIQIQPLGNFPIIKDLVVDMGEFWQNLAQVDPYVSTSSRAIAQKEFLQSPGERAVLNQAGNCILCGACYSECNAKGVTPEFVGPHALAKAYRVLADTRDTATAKRLTQYAQDLSGVWGCTRCFNCDHACPMDVAPLAQITGIKTQILAQPDAPETRPTRHRKAMIDLVAQGGWVDERRFGLEVVGNRFRDLKGMFSLLPLGLNMILHRKFPKTFEASEGTSTVRSLLHSITMRESSPRKSQP